MPCSTDVQGFGELIQQHCVDQLPPLSDGSGTFYLCSQHCWHHPATWQKREMKHCEMFYA